MSTPQTLKELFESPISGDGMDGIDVTQELVNFEGKKIRIGDPSQNGGPPDEFVTFKFAAIVALRSCPPETSADEKVRIEGIMHTLHKAGENNVPITLTSEDKSLIKKLVGERFEPEVMAPMWRIIDPGAYEE